MNQLLEAIEKFNKHKQEYQFRLTSTHLEFVHIYEKRNWSNKREFSVRSQQDIVSKFPLEMFNLPLPKNFKVPSETLASNIVVKKNGAGILSSYDIDYRKIKNVDDLNERIMDACISSSIGTEHRKYFGELISEGLI